MQGASDREQLNAVMACNGQGLVYNRATAGCQKAAGDLTVVQNLDELAAAAANETGMFWVNSSHNERMYFVPREGKLLEVRGQELDLTRVDIPVFGRGQSGGFQTGSTSWDPNHMYANNYLEGSLHAVLSDSGPHPTPRHATHAGCATSGACLFGS